MAIFPKGRAHIAEAEVVAGACGAERELASNGLERGDIFGVSCWRRRTRARTRIKGRRYARAVHDVGLITAALITISKYLLPSARYEAAESHARELLDIAGSQGAESVVTIALQRLESITAARSKNACLRVPR